MGQLLERSFLKIERADKQLLALSGLDLLFGLHYSDTVFFLRPGLDPEVLKSSLVRTSAQIPLLGAQLVLENGQLMFSTDGLGVLFEREIADIAAPPHDDATFPIAGYDFFCQVPQPSSGGNAPWPMLMVKLTTFADGITAIGIRHNHVIMDGTSFFYFLLTWNQNLLGDTGMALEYSRTALTALGHAPDGLPSANAGIPVRDGQLGRRPEQFFDNTFFTCFLAGADCDRIAALIPESAGVSINQVLNALLFKAFVQASAQPDEAPAFANLPFDIRRIKGMQFPANYFGNAVLLRELASTHGAVRAAGVLELARRFKAVGNPTAADARRDIGFYQQQFERCAFGPNGAYNEFASVLSNGGLYINNMLTLRHQPLDLFDGAALGSGPVLPPQFGIRLAMLIPNARHDILIRMTLEPNHATRFRDLWPELIERTLRDGLA